MLLEGRRVTRAFGAVTVLDDCTCTINQGERVGLVGANGAGKSTLMRILAGEDQPDAGTVASAPGVALGYLAQSLVAAPSETVEQVIQTAVAPLVRLAERLSELEARMAAPASDDCDLTAILDEYGVTLSRFQDGGGFELDHRIEEVLAGLRLAHLARERPLATLSGGERARLGLARLLLGRPEVLLLDEPTNHLDMAALHWLEDYLAACGSAMLIASHDRQFLNRTVTRILEIDEHSHRLTRHEGGYDAYVTAKRAERQRWQEEYDRQQGEIKLLRQRMKETAKSVGHAGRQPPDNDKFASSFFGERVQTTISRNVRAVAERLRRIEADPIARPPLPMRFNPRFTGDVARANAVVTLDRVTKRYGERTVLCDVCAEVRPGARIMLVGPNGAGKTTLLRLITGIELPDRGTVTRARNTRPGYLPQDAGEVPPGRTLLEVYRDGRAGDTHAFIAALIGHGFFRLDDVEKPAVALSSGQRRKLDIARLVAAEPTILLLDEPTNYVSLDVLDAFEAAVLDFPGPVVAVSHDRWFIERFGGQVWELTEGRLLIHDAGSSVRLDVSTSTNS